MRSKPLTISQHATPEKSFSTKPSTGALRFLRMAAKSPSAIAVSPALACLRPDGNSILPRHLEPVACCVHHLHTTVRLLKNARRYLRSAALAFARRAIRRKALAPTSNQRPQPLFLHASQT